MLHVALYLYVFIYIVNTWSLCKLYLLLVVCEIERCAAYRLARSDRSKCRGASSSIPDATTGVRPTVILSDQDERQNATWRDRYAFKPPHDRLDKRTMARYTFAGMQITRKNSQSRLSRFKSKPSDCICDVIQNECKAPPMCYVGVL